MDAEQTQATPTQETTQAEAVATPPVTEQTQQPAEQKPADGGAFSKRLAALTKKEQAILEAQKAAKAEREAWEKSKAQIDAELQEARQIKALREKIAKAAEEGDADAVIDELGLSDPDRFRKFMEGATRRALREKERDPEVTAIKQQLRQLQEAEERKQKEAEEHRRRQEQEQQEQSIKAREQQIEEWKNGHALKFVTDNADKFGVLATIVGESADARAQVLSQLVDICGRQVVESSKKDASGKIVEMGNYNLEAAASEVEEKLAASIAESIQKFSKIEKLFPKKAEPKPFEAAMEMLKQTRRIDEEPAPRKQPSTITSRMTAAPIREFKDTTDPNEAFQNALKLMGG